MSAVRSTSPYGTRSRNRTTAPRVNYAEDKDDHMDFEYTSPPPQPATTTRSSANKEASSKKDTTEPEPTTNASANTRSHNQSAPVLTRRASHAAAAIAANAAAAAAAASATNGTSTTTTSQTSGSSRKRKSTAGGHTANNTTTAAAPVPATHVKEATSRSAAQALDRAKERQKLRENVSNMLTFDRHRGTYLNKQGHLVADNGTVLKRDDHLYLVCEPPGEPYYLARIMEFSHANGDPKAPVDSIRVNWYYRPKDVQRKVADTRVIFATMHSDKCPLSSIRGTCTIVHRSEIENMATFRQQKDCFYFDKMYDRYIHRYYEVIPTKAVLNVPEKIRKALTDRWKYVLVEPTRAKELTSKMKVCKRCSGFAGRDDSVSCSLCDSTYHMNCVRPPLLKKPSRGFAWACAPCSRDQERKLEARNTPLQMLNGSGTATGTQTPVEDDFMEDDDDMSLPPNENSGGNTLGASGGANTPNSVRSVIDDTRQPTEEQLYNMSLWPYRYFGIHGKMEDALDFDDRIYPRAASRIGPRHQCVTVPWFGRPVEYVKPAEAKKRSGQNRNRDRRRDGEPKEEAKEKREKWVQDMPPGYIARGEDDSTATLLWKLPDSSRGEDGEGDDERGSEATVTRLTSKLHLSQPEYEELIDKYLEKAKPIAKNNIGVEPNTTNYLDKAMNLLFKNKFDMDTALKQLKQVDKKKDLKEPEFKGEELKRFEEGVALFGSELHAVTKHVRTRKEADVVRFYYIWKKTQKGKEIWGNYDGRKSKKESKSKDNARLDSKDNVKTELKLIDDVADDYDDSAFDDDKAHEKKKAFQCKFCKTKTSVQWRRAPGVPPGAIYKDGKSSRSHPEHEVVISLCRRCGELWRKYAIQWEDLEEAAKKLSQGNAPKQGKRRVDEDLLREISIVNKEDEEIREKVQPLQEQLAAISAKEAAAAASTASTPSLNGTSDREPPRKKSKGLPDTSEPAAPPTPTPAVATSKSATPASSKDTVAAAIAAKESADAAPAPATTSSSSRNRKKEKVAPAPVEPPKPKLLPCAVCEDVNPVGSEHLVCRDCKLTVHRSCYGVGELRSANKWVCDMCANDKNPVVSTDYTCVLCPVRSEGEVEEELRARAATANSNNSRSSKDKAKDEKEKEETESKDKGKQVAPAAPEKEESKKSSSSRGDNADKTRPQYPRQPLKQTTGNNWVHVTCAIWTPEIRFGNAKALIPAEGIGSIPTNNFQKVCSVCNVSGKGSCITCHQCHVPVHVGCARKAGWTFGFDVQPVKSSRRDVVNMVTVGNETGNMQACVWCKNHDLKTPVHAMNEKLDDGETTQIALQLYVNNYKQADLTLTGTVRKAQLVTLSTKASQQSRRASLITAGPIGSSASSQPGRHSTSSPSGLIVNEDRHREASPLVLNGKIRRCHRCGVDVSPMWHKAPPSAVVSTGSLISGGMALPGKQSPVVNAGGDDVVDLWYCHRCDYSHKTGTEETKPKLKHSLFLGGIVFDRPAPPPPQPSVSPVKTVLHQLDPRDQQMQQPPQQQPPSHAPTAPPPSQPPVQAHVQHQTPLQPHMPPQPQVAYHDRPPLQASPVPPIVQPHVQHPMHSQPHHPPLPQIHHQPPVQYQQPEYTHPLHPRLPQPQHYAPPPPSSHTHHMPREPSQPLPHPQLSPTKASHSPYHYPTHPPPPPSHIPAPPPPHYAQPPQRTPPQHHQALHPPAGLTHRSPPQPPSRQQTLQPAPSPRGQTPLAPALSPTYHHSPPRHHDPPPVSQPVTPSHAHRVYATPEPRAPPPGGHGASGSPALANLLHP